MRDANREGLGVWRGGYNGWGKVIGPSYGSVTKFRKPQAQEVKPRGYYYVFCPHHNLYIHPCRACGRDRAAALAHAKSMGLVLLT